MIDEGIFALLSADAGVSALVGSHIYAVEGPPDATKMPYVVYKFVGGSNQGTLNTSGTFRQRVEINAHAAIPKGGLQPGTIAAKIRTAVIAAMNGWRQTLADGTRVLDTFVVNPGADFCSEQMIFRCMAEFYVLYTLPAS